MSMWQIDKTEANVTETITGALTYNEALRKLDTLKREETSEEVSYKVSIFMPIRAAREAKQEGSKFEVKVSDSEGKLQTVFSVDRIAYTAPGNMIAQYPALGTFQDSCHQQDGSLDSYRYSGGFVEVRKLP
jgi:hypothetical protein